MYRIVILIGLIINVFSLSFSKSFSNCDEETTLTEIARRISNDIDRDSRSLISTGKWPSEQSWSTSIILLSEEAYLISIEAFRKLLNKEENISEFSMLSSALTILRPEYAVKRRRLTEISQSEKHIEIPFTMDELFENGSHKSTRISFKYLPSIGLVYNTLPSLNGFMADKLRTACDWYNPGLILTEYAEDFAPNAGLKISSHLHKLNEMMRLHVKAKKDRVSFAVMSIMFAECWAFMQIDALKNMENLKSLNSFKSHVGRAVRLLQKKYGVAALLIDERKEEL